MILCLMGGSIVYYRLKVICLNKIVTIEDITQIVGISNYIQALNLDQSKLIYDTYETLGSRIKVHFHYETLPITVMINKEYRMIDMDCGCKPGLDYCSHIALAIMYLIEHEEDVKQMIAQLNSEYDSEFNQKLLQFFQREKKSKKKVTLDITLKQTNYHDVDTYELQVKIGEDKKYILKKQLDTFLEVFKTQKGEVNFGQYFCYRPEDYFIEEIDQKIIEFVAFYVDSQNNTYRNFYGYHAFSQRVDSILLTGESLLQFMKCLARKKFTVEIGYRSYSFDGINEKFPYQMSLEAMGSNIGWKIHQTDLKPFISNYEYIMIGDKMYHVKEHDLLQLLIESKKQDIVIKQEEMPAFTKHILPKIEDNIEMDTLLQKKIVLKLPTAKYCFEKDANRVVGTIYLCYQGIEKNIFEEGNDWNGVYLKRDDKLEEQYQQELYKRGFVKMETSFLLMGNHAIVTFLEEGLKELANAYEVYGSKELKEMRVLRHVSVQSNFSLGSDNILSYQFQMEKVSKEELEDLLNSLQLKKKFYRLKNGSFVDLEQESIRQLQTMVNGLEIDHLEGTLPLYKSLSLERYQGENICVNTLLQDFLSRFRQYQSFGIEWNSDNQEILRDYQKIGIQWMITLSHCGFSGILADEMGLGKSLQTIEYMKYKLKENKGIMLVVVPTSLIYNWEHELQQFGKNLHYAIVNENKSKRIHLLQHLDAYDVVLTTYGLLRQDVDFYKKYTFDTCIIDEAQNIKNANTETTRMMKQIHAKTKFALTGTPIENSVLELWSIFDFLMPSFLSSYSKFREKYSVKAIEENPNLLTDLNEQISPFILRRRKKDVLKELPDKIENNIYVDLTVEQKKLYLACLEQTKKQIETTLREDGFAKSQILILSLLTRLRQICIDPRLYIETDIRSGKLDTLLEVLKGSIQNGHKILLFSQFPSALKLVQKELQENDITSYYLDGSTLSKTRIALVDAFNQDETNVFLISLKAGGTGLNLTSADVVIHLDLWWNPQVENQATDRSHRIGQKHTVEVIRLIAKGTIEEKILELQQKKRNLSEQVIEGENRDQIILSKLTEEELISILETD